MKFSKLSMWFRLGDRISYWYGFGLQFAGKWSRFCTQRSMATCRSKILAENVLLSKMRTTLRWMKWSIYIHRGDSKWRQHVITSDDIVLFSCNRLMALLDQASTSASESSWTFMIKNRLTFNWRILYGRGEELHKAKSFVWGTGEASWPATIFSVFKMFL